MSERAKGLLIRIAERLIDGPKCRNCDHDADIHTEEKCLGAVYDHGTHVSWCDCPRLRRRGKANERNRPDAVREPDRS